MAYAAELLGLDRSVAGRAAVGATPPAAGLASERSRRRQTDNKRVSNRKMRAELLPQGPTYPTYREGLRGLEVLEL